MKILLILEHNNQQLNAVNYATLSATQQLVGEIDVLVLGFECEAVIKAAQKLPGIQKVRVANAIEYKHQLVENSAELIADLAKNYQYVLVAASTFGKNLLPRVAALLDVAMVADVIKIISEDTFERHIYAGSAIATIKTPEPIKLMTIRTTAFSPVIPNENSSIIIEEINKIVTNKSAKFIKQEHTISTRPELTVARIIIAGGRGLKSAENFKVLEKLADKLGAAVGASRAAVDAGFAPNDYQVGQTGKVVAPDLYIAVGISGAIQHLAGMKDSKTIVAINNDPDAPIFAMADYILVMDLFTALAEWEKLCN